MKPTTDSIPCECGRSYAGETGRLMAMQLLGTDTISESVGWDKPMIFQN
jgi:hypothetical protein